MFFGKSEKKRWNPGLVIAIGALAAIGTLTVIDRGRCALESIKSKLSGMVRGECACDCECD